MEKLKRKIYENIANSGLQVDAVYYLIKDIYREITDLYSDYLTKQQKNENKEKEDREEGKE